MGEPVSYAVRGRDVVIAERLTIGPADQLTLLQVTLQAIAAGGDPERIDAARSICAMVLGAMG
jgi:hypothetical protein